MTKPSPAERRMTGRPRQVADCGRRTSLGRCRRVLLKLSRSATVGCTKTVRWRMSTRLACQRLVRRGGEGDKVVVDQREAAVKSGMAAQ